MARQQPSFLFTFPGLALITSLVVATLVLVFNLRETNVGGLKIAPMSNVQYMDRERFLRDYHLQLNKEFEIDNEAAEWAPGDYSGPRLWGQEDASITLEQDDPIKGNVESIATAVSPDDSLLAVSTNAVIRIYDVHSREMRGELVGHSSNVQSLRFAHIASVDSASLHENAKYVLLSEGAEVGGGDGQIIVWHLNGDGHLLDAPWPLPAEDMAAQAIGTISEDLTAQYNLAGDEMALLLQSFAEALKDADQRHRISGLSVFEGHLPSFGSNPVSHDGRQMLYIDQGMTTQGGMRPEDELPQIVVVSLNDSKERCRLKGHEDAIMWAGWSLDDRVIVTASWDATYKIWDASTGECRHTIGPTGGQNWAGGFSPDGQHVLLSGGSPTQVAIYDIESGVKAFELDLGALNHQRGWIRELQWNPQSEDVALVIGQTVVLWEPATDAVETVFALGGDGSMLDNFNSLNLVQWLEGGKKLAVSDNDDTVFVWDRENDVKWRLQRPQGTALRYYEGGLFYVAEQKLCIVLNGDGIVRYWKL